MIAGTRNGEVVLSVEDVCARRGSLRVLDGVTFDVLDRIRDGRTTGQVVSLLGPSGTGKTTLLRVIAGLDRPARGEVRGPGRSLLDAGTVGIVFQDYPLLEHRTVIENLVLAGRIGGMAPDRARARAAELLARVGLGDRAASWPARLSGGQRQRAAIAQQLVLPRRVLLLDEPFSGLDPAAVDAIVKLIGEVADDHELNTVVIVTHDVRAALDVSDTVLLLGRGAEGQGARIRGRYDLVELDLAWEHAASAPGRRSRLEREIAARFHGL
jgi:polar amino acid transport system ATP-binding protein/sulfate transport system ATP-binding protein